MAATMSRAVLEPGALAPDGLALRLAGHYAPSANDPLALLRWTGRVLPGTAALCEQVARPEVTSDGKRDPQAVEAELRALAHYCRVHDGRGEVDGWRTWDAEAGQMVVPWAWREARP